MDGTMSGATTNPSARSVFLGENTREQQETLEHHFFKSLRMPNWTFKDTEAGRLVPFDDLLARHLPESDGPLSVLDVGIASGITTLDLANRLDEAGRPYEIVGVDQYLHARLVRALSSMDALYSSRNELLQVTVGDYVRPLPQGPVAWKRAVAGAVMGTLGLVAKVAPGQSEEVTLVSRAVKNHPAISFQEQDIRQARPDWVGRFHIVRAANILNHTYFSEDQLVAMVAALAPCLMENGIFAVCRSAEGTGVIDGSLFARRPGTDGLDELDRLGEGSEIAAIVNRFRFE